MIRRSSLSLAIACVFLIPSAGSRGEEVALFETPEELIALQGDPDSGPPDYDANYIRYIEDIEYRKYVKAAIRHAWTAEEGETPTPFRDAILADTLSMLQSDERAAQLFTTLFRAGQTSDEIDLYLMLGDSNMMGLTALDEPWNGSGPAIESCMQNYADSGHKVLAMNCARPGTAVIDWEVDLESGMLTYLLLSVGYIKVHNPTRECIEVARDLVNADGKRARIKGVFVNVGGADAWWCRDDFAGPYERVVDYFRTEFGDIPFVHAQLPGIPETWQEGADNEDPWFVPKVASWVAISNDQAAVTLPSTAMVTTNELTQWDDVHFDEAGQTELGKKFATEMLTLQGEVSPSCP